MLLELNRSPSANDCTHGALSVDGVFECFTLEDVIREIPKLAVTKWKIPCQTAIPSGTYSVIVNFSAHFNKQLPLLVDVPGFDGVRIHSGNYSSDTEGCILVGQSKNDIGVYESRAAFALLFAKIQKAIAAGDKVRISITNPPITPSPRAVGRA